MSVGESAESGRRAGVTAGSLLIIVAALAIWAALYLSGACPWLGYAWLQRSSIGVGERAIVGETKAGSSFGAKTFLFLAGQDVVVDYDADIRAGALWLYVYRPFDGVLGDGVAHYVTETGSGIWAVRINETGFYSISIGPTVTQGGGHGWDMNYAVWWGARRG
jgi:hypothetical protein